MKVDKYTEQSGLMPRHEWAKLMEINTSLLEACKETKKWLSKGGFKYGDTLKIDHIELLMRLEKISDKAIKQAESE